MIELETGRIIERYVVEGLLGQGGMASVYLIRHRQLGTPHALKLLGRLGPGAEVRLMLEGRVQAALRHRNVVAVTDVLEVDGAPGLLMEYVEPPSLSQWLVEARPDPAEAERIFRGIVAGVRHAHRHDLVHRDLKPSNVLLGREDDQYYPKVADFGLAKILGDDPTGGQTRSGHTMGTPQYMAPEQFRDAKKVDQRADIFSLGCILHELVAHQPAFAWTDFIRIYGQISSQDYPRLPAGTPKRFQAVVDACLEPERDARLPDCDAILAMLGGASHEEAMARSGAGRVPATRQAGFAGPMLPGHETTLRQAGVTLHAPAEASLAAPAGPTAVPFAAPVDAPPRPRPPPPAATPAPPTRSPEPGSFTTLAGMPGIPAEVLASEAAQPTLVPQPRRGARPKRGAPWLAIMLGAAGALALAVVVAAGAYFIDGGTEVPDDPASTDPAPADALSTTDDAPEALGAGGGTGDASTPVDVESSPPPAAVPPLSPTTKVPTATHAPAQSSTSTTPTAARTANTASAAASGATASAPSADGSDAPSASVSSSRSPSTTPVPEPAHVSITGDAARVVAVSGSTRLTLPAELPAGQWDLLADFPDLQGTIAGRITVADGERLTVNCIASMAQCRRK